MRTKRMKKLLFILVLTLLTGCGHKPPSADPNAFTFAKVFPDPILAEIIAELFDKEKGDTTSVEELAGYTGEFGVWSQGFEDEASNWVTVKSLEGIGYLKGITSFFCCKNEVTELPAEIRQLKNLKKINLNKAFALKIIPSSISELENLEELDITFTAIEELPKEIGQLKSLRILVANYTGISSLPDEIGDLKNLEELEIQGTNITLAPDSICKLKNLKFLNMGDLGLEKLPDDIGDLQNLENLFLFSNNLKNLPRSMEKMTNLQNINLYNNFELSEDYKAFLPKRLWEGKNF